MPPAATLGAEGLRVIDDKVGPGGGGGAGVLLELPPQPTNTAIRKTVIQHSTDFILMEFSQILFLNAKVTKGALGEHLSAVLAGE